MMLRYFHPDEFGEWLPFMSVRLLVMLDVLRHMWGQPIRVSPAKGALGRRLGERASQHNVDRWKEVRAIDVMPQGIDSEDQAHVFYMLALDIGFTGVGFYPDWRPSPGFHLDVREDRKPGDAATWGGVATPAGQHYVSVNDAMERMA